MICIELVYYLQKGISWTSANQSSRHATQGSGERKMKTWKNISTFLVGDPGKDAADVAKGGKGTLCGEEDVLKHWHNKKYNIQRSYLYYLYHITCLCLEWSVHWGRNAQLQNGSDRERGTSSNVVVMIFIKLTLHNDVWQEYCDLTYHQVRNGCIWMPDNYVKDHVIIYTRILRHLIKTKTKVIANAISRNINLQNLRRASAFIDVMDRKVDRVILVQWWNFPCLLQEAQDFLDHYRDVLAKNKMIQNKGIYKRWPYWFIMILNSNYCASQTWSLTYWLDECKEREGLVCTHNPHHCDN